MEDEDAPCEGGWRVGGYSVGAVSTFLSTVLTFPIYKTIFRQQLHTMTIREATRQLGTEGITHLYRGLGPPLLAKTVQGTLLFGTQGTIQHRLSGGNPRPKHRCLSGLLSGALEATLLTPFERVQNVLQDGRKNIRFPSASSILREFWSYRGHAWLRHGIYRGFTPILARNTLGSAIYFSSKDPLRDALSVRGLPTWMPALGSGAVNGALTSLALYPLSVLVSNMQAEVGRVLPRVRVVAGVVWAHCGGRVSLLYRGASLIALRSCVTWGVTTAIHDTLTKRGQDL
ncbi:hypothetical protein FKM82_026309 [Ascaphus truei]